MFAFLKFTIKALVAFTMSFLILNIPVSNNKRFFHLISKNVNINYGKMFHNIKQGASEGIEQGKKLTKEYGKKFLDNNLQDIKKTPSSKNTTRIQLDNYTEQEKEFVKKILEAN
jgi:hypothetical protein